MDCKQFRDVLYNDNHQRFMRLMEHDDFMRQLDQDNEAFLQQLEQQAARRRFLECFFIPIISGIVSFFVARCMWWR